MMSRRPCTMAHAAYSGRLHYLQAVGAARLSRRYAAELQRLLVRNRAWLGGSEEGERASFMMGDTPIQMMSFGEEQTEELERGLDGLITGNTRTPRTRTDVGFARDFACRAVSVRAHGESAMVGSVSIDRP